MHAPLLNHMRDGMSYAGEWPTRCTILPLGLSSDEALRTILNTTVPTYNLGAAASVSRWYCSRLQAAKVTLEADETH